MIPTPPPARPGPARPQPQPTAPPANLDQFDGIQPGEVVIFRARPHPLYLLIGSERILMFAIVALALYLITAVLASFSTPLPYIIVGVFLVFAFHYVGWMAEDVNYWLSREYILTNWRLIVQWGWLTQHRRVAPLGRIQHVQLERVNLLVRLLDLGQVRVTTAATDEVLVLAGARNPREWVLQIYYAQLNAMPAGPRAIELEHERIKAAWARIAEPEELPEAESPYGRLLHPHSPANLRLPVQMINGEQILDCYRRHPIAMLRPDLPAFGILFLGCLIGFLYANSGNPSVGFIPILFILGSVLVAFVWVTVVFLNYVDDMLVLTTHRVIDVERLFFIFAESRNQAVLRRIQDVNVNQGFWGERFRYGAVIVETAGPAPNIQMDHVPFPFEVQNRIQACITAATDRSEMTQRKIRYKREFRRWMARTLNELLVEVPDLRGKTMLDAAETARELDLRLIVAAEQDALGLPAGVVLEQAPNAGTMAMRGNEVRVILSRRARVPVAPGP